MFSKPFQTFTYTMEQEDGTHITHIHEFQDGTDWHQLLTDFYDFIQGCGYILPDTGHFDLAQEGDCECEEEEEEPEEPLLSFQTHQDLCECRSCDMGREELRDHAIRHHFYL